KAPPSPCQEKWEPVIRPAWRQMMRARKPGGNRMPTVLLTHTPDMLANYYGDRALAALRALCDVRLNDTGKVLDAAALAKLAQGCEIIVSDRQTPGPAEFFAQATA